jgi:hypothetical protein
MALKALKEKGASERERVAIESIKMLTISDENKF